MHVYVCLFAGSGSFPVFLLVKFVCLCVCGCMCETCVRGYMYVCACEHKCVHGYH